jgi:arylsulfatase A-like enzyme
VLITIDTMRADRCSLYGAARPTTPFLDELARTSVVFDAAYGASSWTPPSMASIFTGLPPRAHGVTKGAIREGATVNQQVLDDRFTTIAESFRAAGYYTIGVSSNAHVVRRTGFSQGFDAFRAPLWKGANEVNAAARELAAARPPGKPLMLWVHYFDPHNPYVPHAPWIDSFDVDFAWIERCAGAEQDALLAEAQASGNSPKMQAALLALYDSEIAFVDAALRRLFHALPLAGNALVAITSDHGETVMNRGWIGHGNSLNDEETRVPLLIRLPGSKTARRVATPVSNMDLFGTLLDAAGLPRPPRVDRPSLLAPAAAAAPVLLELNRAAAEDQAAVRVGRHKLYQRFSPQADTELFDLVADPQERHDLAATAPELRDRLAATLQQSIATWPRHAAAQQEADPADPELIERLRSLGYLDSTNGR